MNVKGKRVASDIVKELGNLLLTEVKDEDLKNVTITFAEVSNDLSFAKIYFTTLDDLKRDKVIHDMNYAAKYFRTELAQRLDIRHMPELKFVYDESIEYGIKIEKMIDEINKQD
ncbi:MAG: 30S ribosome-binding factor RbfA [Bacilli bacterium]